MSAGWQAWASQKTLTAINHPCDNNPGNPIGSAIVDETAKDSERKLANLATKKHGLALAN